MVRRRSGESDWLYHRAGDGAADTGICWQFDNGTAYRTCKLTTGGGVAMAADCSKSGSALYYSLVHRGSAILPLVATEVGVVTFTNFMLRNLRLQTRF